MHWTVDSIRGLLKFFEPYCSERTTFDRLLKMIDDESQWSQCHHLFSEIRTKTLLADQEKDARLQCQYSFEEIIAKTLYNFECPTEGVQYSVERPAPFDADVAYWVVPRALSFATALKLDPMLVVDAI